MRTIVHLDADAFFAAVEQAADQKLRGKPIAVGGERRGIIASASYEARRFGVYTPMPTARARKLCPKLIVLPGDFERYEQFSNWMFGYCYDFTPDVEQTSIDEGYFDLTANRRKPPVEIALTIRKAIADHMKIACPLCNGSGAVSRGVHDHFGPLLKQFNARNCDSCGTVTPLPSDAGELTPHDRDRLEQFFHGGPLYCDPCYEKAPTCNSCGWHVAADSVAEHQRQLHDH